MEFKIIDLNNEKTAIIDTSEIVIHNISDAMNIMAESYLNGVERILLSKQNITDDFFDLSTGLAGEILQKFINYRMKISISGDFSKSSKSFKDFVYESNTGNMINFIDEELKNIF